MTFGIDGEPTFYLNDLAGTADVDVSGVKSIQEMDEKPITTYLPAGTITSLKASEAQKWFQFKGGKIDGNVYDAVYDGDLMYGVKSVTNTEFPNIPDKAANNTTLRFHQYNLQDDYLGTLSEKVFGSAEAANLFANVPELKKSYNEALKAATRSSNDLMNDISGTTVNGIDVSKKLAKTIMAKYPERYELKFQAEFGVDLNGVPNGHLGYDTSLPPGDQTTKDWFVYNNTAAQDIERSFRFAKVNVTLSNQNEIDSIVLSKQGDGYKLGDTLYLIKDISGVTSVSGEEVTLVTSVSGEEVTTVPLDDQFIVFDSILDVQANTFNHSLNLEDILYSAELAEEEDDDADRAAQNASITRRLFLRGVTTDATLEQRDASDVELGKGAEVSVVCGDGSGGDVTSGNDGAVFQSMIVTQRGYEYEEGNTLTVYKNNAKITHTIDISDAIMLNLGVLTVSKAVITSLPVYNNGASGEVVSTHDASGVPLHTDTDSTDGSGAIVVVTTKTLAGTDVSFIEVDSSGSGYVVNDVVRITNPDNEFQTIDLSLTQFDANLLNGLTILDLSQGNPTIDTRSFRTHDNGVPSKILGKTERGNIVELDVSNNGTWVQKITVRDGSITDGSGWTITDTIIITNISASNETLELSGEILDASFINALNSGEEYILTHDVSGTDSLIDSSNALTAALTGGAYFEDASTNDIVCTDLSGVIADSSGAVIEVSTTESSGATIIINGIDPNGIEPILELKVTESGAGYQAGHTMTIKNNYQIITKVLTPEDAKLLNGIKELGGNNYPGTGEGNDNNNRKITSIQIFTDGAFGEASGLDGSGAIIRVNTSDVSDSILSVLTVRTGGSGYNGTGDVTITNLEDANQTIVLTIDASNVDNTIIDIDELNNSANKILNIKQSDVQPLFYGGTCKDVQAVRNGVNNKYSEAVVTIICDGNQSDGNQSEGGLDRGAKIQAISLQSAAMPGTDNTDELYYEQGDKVTFTVDQDGEHLNEDYAINQDGEHTNVAYTVKYVITISSLTKEQADVLNGNMVGTNVPLLPGDVLVLMSTISSPPGIEGQEQFEQSFLTQYQLAEDQ